MDLPVAVAQRGKVPVIGEVEHLLPCAGPGAGQQRQLVVAVQMHLVGAGADLVAGQQLLLDLCLPGGGEQRRHPILKGHDVVDHLPRLDAARPADRRRRAEAAFPGGRLLAPEGGVAAIGPGHHLGAVVGGVDDDGVLRDAEVVQLLQQLADMPVMLDHPIGIDAEAGDAPAFRLQPRPDMHPRRVEPGEEGPVGPMRAVDEVQRASQEFLIHRFHPLHGQRAGILDALGAVRVRPGLQHAARRELAAEFGVARVVRVFRLVFGIQVVEAAEELVEAVHRRQMFVAVAQVVLAELAGGVAERLQQAGDGRVLRPHALGGAGQADLRQAGADRALACDEGGAAGGAGILGIVVGEHRAFAGDAVDVGRAVAHHPHVVGRDIRPADIVPEDHEDVGASLRRGGGGGWRLRRRRRPGLRLGQRRAPRQRACGNPRRAAQQHPAPRAAMSVVVHLTLSPQPVGASRRMQRKPIWLMPVSTICAWRAAGR